MSRNFDDVVGFSRRFGMPTPESPTLLAPEVLRFRTKLLHEEFTEFVKAAETGNIVEMFDALLDITYVSMGTAAMMGLPWQEGWDEVQRSNMEKQPGQGKRGFWLDVVKPAGWRPPDLKRVVLRAYARVANRETRDARDG